ncbi:MAG: YhfL family protein [Mixta calida]|nr:YhfL family protein [Mixta calida]
MKKAIKVALLAAVVATLSGCTGSVYTKEKNCDYDYLLHPAISVSKIIGGCGPVDR